MLSNEVPQAASRKVLRPRARILRTIGDELISSETVAVIELVKNAYDADATRVLVSYQAPLELGKGVIEVIDNGHGMSLDIIQESWMEPATLTKRNKKYSKYFNRRVLGEKGVGRFATSKLADYLEIVSRYKESDREVHAIFDWKQFDDEQKYLDEVEVSWDETKPSNFKPRGSIQVLWDLTPEVQNPDMTHGTILRMKVLRTSWTRSQLATLRNGLSRLISPFLKLGEDEFAVYLQLPSEFEDLSGKVETSETLERPHYRIQGHFRNDGRYDLTLTLNELGQEEQLQGSLVTNGHPPACGSFYIDLRVWNRDQDSLGIMAQSNDSTVRDIRKDLDRAAGINIYRDGFRVLPYGEPGNDWLRLDLRRVQNPTMRLSNNQIVGYILISGDDNPNLRDQSNREGLMAGQAFDDLRDAVVKILSELEARRFKIRHPVDDRQSKSKPAGIFRGFDISPIRTALKQLKVEDPELSSLIDEQEKELKKQVAVVQEILSRYQRLATLGQLIDTVLHDGRTPLFKIGSEAQLGLRDIERSSEENGLLKVLAKRFSSVKDQATLIGNIFRKIEPFGGRKRGRPSKSNIEDIITDAFSVLDSEIARKKVKIELPQTKTEVFVESSEIQLVIINLLNNSLYWLDNIAVESRKIAVSVNRNSNNSVEILFSDSGPGVDPEFRERIFQPYFTMKPDGVGLGLAIAGEIVLEYYAGSLELIENGLLPGATFRITLGRRV
jgi:signal transduction histidine kinase